MRMASGYESWAGVNQDILKNIFTFIKKKKKKECHAPSTLGLIDYIMILFIA